MRGSQSEVWEQNFWTEYTQTSVEILQVEHGVLQENLDEIGLAKHYDCDGQERGGTGALDSWGAF